MKSLRVVLVPVLAVVCVMGAGAFRPAWSCGGTSMPGGCREVAPSSLDLALLPLVAVRVIAGLGG